MKPKTESSVAEVLRYAPRAECPAHYREAGAHPQLPHDLAGGAALPRVGVVGPVPCIRPERERVESRFFSCPGEYRLDNEGRREVPTRT